jgi:hypothetical protein
MQRVLTKTEAAAYLGLSLESFGRICKISPLPYEVFKEVLLI